jgi:hypothetical protein
MAYIIQVQSAAWYVKFADTIFGKPIQPVNDQKGLAGSTMI